MKKILFITQSFPCGSWLCIEKIVEKLSLKKFNLRILGLGKPAEKLKNVSYHLIPYFTYTRYGNITCISPVFGLLWYLPLYFFALIIALFYNPKTIIYNGLTSGLALSPFFKIIGKKNIIMYHSVIGDCGKTTKKILRTLFRFVDLVVVNSIGMRDDLSEVVDGKKLVVNEHYADDVFFQIPAKEIKSHKNLKVLYAGRIDKDKRCFPLIDFAKKMKNNPNFDFKFVGMGSDVNKVARLPKSYKHIKYGGYIKDKRELARLYLEADVVWGFADTTYLALPAVEALACGTPIIVPKYAAIAGKDELIDPSLVPPSVGWLVDPFSSKEVEKIMQRVQKQKGYLGKKCRQYARKHYSDNNLFETVKKIIEEIKPKSKKED